MALDKAPLSVLFVGGTGTISASSVRLAVDSGMTVYVLNRGNNAKSRSLPASVKFLTGDITERSSVDNAIEGLFFDAVVNFLTFNAAGAQLAVETFRGRTKHYVHISTASLYGKPVLQVPIVESTPIHNRFVAYSRAKIAAEEVLWNEYRSSEFPMTIVRPSHTYDDANPPLPGDWTIFDRIERGAEIVVHGDGTSLWTLTHADDFAQGLVGLLGNPRAVGEAFHITGDDVYTWDQIYTIVGEAVGVEPKLVHVPSELFLVGAPDWFWSELLMGDLGHSAIFDNTKIHRFVPGFRPTLTFHRAAHRMQAWRLEHPDLTGPNDEVNAVLDRMAKGYAASRAAFAALAPKGT
ncbi:MAG TPA: NAD-dependent epimerase/dehydratase family protein [Galbitalea sp.]|nr:NAD-dependent epimerase/dehydratase family protein [Galbitalea sp.]